MSINENSARSRWAFLKKAFASMALGAAGAVSLKSAIQPVVEGRADTVATAVKEIEPYLKGLVRFSTAHTGGPLGHIFVVFSKKTLIDYLCLIINNNGGSNSSY